MLGKQYQFQRCPADTKKKRCIIPFHLFALNKIDFFFVLYLFLIMNHQGTDESTPIPEVNLRAYMTSLLGNINLTFET